MAAAAFLLPPVLRSACSRMLRSMHGERLVVVETAIRHGNQRPVIGSGHAGTGGLRAAGKSGSESSKRSPLNAIARSTQFSSCRTFPGQS